MTASVQPATASGQATISGPIVKWAGGKTRLLPELLKRVPPHVRYFEPFLGGAALFFALQPSHAVLSDANPDLIAMYRAVVDSPHNVCDWLELHATDHSEPHYAEVRAAWNAQRARSLAERAAQFLYLNKTCFNGLWRVNRAGKFNVGFGDYKNPTICDREAILAASVALQGVELRAGDYREIVVAAEPGDFVYFDPPYDGAFTGYTRDPFGSAQQRELADVLRGLVERDVHVLASNSDTTLVRSLYPDFEIHVVRCARAINSDGQGRGDVDELLLVGDPNRRFMTRQTTIPNTDPIEPHPEVRDKLHAWLRAVDDAKEYRDVAKRCHDTLLDAIQEAKIPYYTYDADGKRKRVYPTVADPKLKTQNVASLEPKGRRGRARDVAMPIDKAREKAVEGLDRLQLSNAEANDIVHRDLKPDNEVEHRRVSRASVSADADPFARTRSLLDEAEQKQKGTQP